MITLNARISVFSLLIRSDIMILASYVLLIKLNNCTEARRLPLSVTLSKILVRMYISRTLVLTINILQTPIDDQKQHCKLNLMAAV